MTDRFDEEGNEMFAWARDLFPIHRSLTGAGVRQTLAYLAELVPALRVLDAPSGTRAFDWTVPNEWTIRDAYIADESGTRIVDVRSNNLHVVGYSVPVDTWLTRAELDAHLHSLPQQPSAIPYVTSYYAPYWGFCLSHDQRMSLADGRYHVVVDSEIAQGAMNVGEIVLPGSERTEVLLSANICHPSLANNELSGMLVLTALARWLSAQSSRKHTYRIVLVPETIGAVWYLSQNAEWLRRSVIAGFVATCMGDDRAWSYLPSRKGGTLADRVAQHVLRHRVRDFDRYSYLDRGSDERQYCSPGIDLPVCSIMRSKYGTYPEYHTSLDDLSVISPAGLQGSLDVLRECVQVLEANHTWLATTPCEPQLGKRGLYPDISDGSGNESGRRLLDILAYCDGSLDVVGIADVVGMSALACADALGKLEAAGLVEVRPGAP